MYFQTARGQCDPTPKTSGAQPQRSRTGPSPRPGPGIPKKTQTEAAAHPTTGHPTAMHNTERKGNKGDKEGSQQIMPTPGPSNKNDQHQHTRQVEFYNTVHTTVFAVHNVWQGQEVTATARTANNARIPQ